MIHLRISKLRHTARSPGYYPRMRVLLAVGAALAFAVAAAPVAAAAPGPVYANCSQAREAGVSNIPRGDPAYWPDGDRDGDGIACESN